ncbi:eukaryotic translation initiation factor 3 subunit G-like [Lycorma delicatula]|uniref:eukaryotic translation initiation factor 3 subunit G-like n=1 Tax=Lycorma delicatula TaxID=130591 RepID=UPI003F5126E5
MRVPDEVKSSWADEVEQVGGALPPPSEHVENGIKTVTEYKYNDDNKKMKIVRTYKVEKRVVSKNIALRKTWAKYGDSKDEKPGPNPQTTFVAEDVFMQFITNKEEQDKPEEDLFDKLRSMGEKGGVKCRTCNGDHWTTRCPYKETRMVLGKPDDKKVPPVPEEKPKTTVVKYVPPSMRDGASGKRGDSMNNARSRDDSLAIRISNLSESTQETDLEDLVKPFGPISKIFLAKDKPSGLCKGFAYIHFKVRADAAKAIAKLDGHGYDHLILSVDWSKPANQN